MMDTCASGGRRIEIETLRRMAPLHRTDWEPSPSYSPAQAHNYGLSLWVPVHGPSGTPTDLQSMNTTAFLSTFSSADTCRRRSPGPTPSRAARRHRCWHSALVGADRPWRCVWTSVWSEEQRRVSTGPSARAEWPQRSSPLQVLAA
jgi:hypothetical protein